MILMRGNKNIPVLLCLVVKKSISNAEKQTNTMILLF